MRYVLLNANKSRQLINMPLAKTQFHPVESMTDRICTVVSLETGSEVDSMVVFSAVESAYNGGAIESSLVINEQTYFLLFVD